MLTCRSWTAGDRDGIPIAIAIGVGSGSGTGSGLPRASGVRRLHVWCSSPDPLADWATEVWRPELGMPIRFPNRGWTQPRRREPVL